MKPMVFLSAGAHLFLLALLFAFHYFEWKNPKIKPHILSVQLLSLPVPHEKEKSPPSEPVKKPALIPSVKVQKEKVPAVKLKIKPSPHSADSIPLKSARKETPQAAPLAQSKTQTPISPPVQEARKEEVVPVEPQKVEISQISEIDPLYTDRMKRKIDSNWNPPPFSGIQKEATVIIEILKSSGMVKSARIIKSSGDAYFDIAVRRAVMESRSFGPLPADYPNLSIEITCTFSQNKGS
ncbi:MAG: energy transducer TonB [Nitrospiria bacterium]